MFPLLPYEAVRDAEQALGSPLLRTRNDAEVTAGVHSMRLLSPEEKEAYLQGDEELQKVQAQIAEMDRQEDALLEPYGFDDAIKSLVKNRALLQAARKMPRSIGELAANPDTWLSKVPLIGGLNSVRIMAPAVLIARRLEGGEEVSQEELQMLHETLIEMGRPNTWLAATLDMAAESASIGIEMLTTVGVATATRKAVTKLGKEAIHVYLKKFADVEGRRGLVRLAERKAGTSLAVRGLAGVAGVAAQTATGTLSRVLGRTVTDLGTKGVQVTQNDLDQYVATVDATQRPGSVWAAFGKAFRYQFMENTSEKLGGVFNALGGEQAVRQALRGLSEPMRDRLGKQALLLAVARANPGKKLEAVQKMLARANVDSLPVEMAEEVGSAALHWAFDGEEFHLPTAEDAASLAVTMLMTGSVMKVANWRDGQESKEARASRGTALGRVLREQGEVSAAVTPSQAGLETGASAEVSSSAFEAGGISTEGEGKLSGAASGNAEAGVGAAAVPGTGVQPRLSFSQGSQTPGSWLRELAQDWRRFLRKGPTDSKDLGDIVAHHRVTPSEATVVDMGQGVVGDDVATFAFKMEAGGEAYMHVRGSDVWVDTSTMRADDPNQLRQGGDLVYQLAMTYARNNGLKFVPDPNGVKAIARRRRISQMLSSALRYRSTNHLSPYGVNPATQAAYEEVTGWRNDNSEEAYQHNVELLAQAELDYVREEMQQRGLDITDLHYDEKSDTVWRDSTRQRLSQGDFKTLLARMDSRNSGVGATTLSRALVTSSRVEGQESGRHRPEHREPAAIDGRGGVSQDPGSELFHLRGPDADPNNLFYSQQQGNNLEGSATGSRPVQRTGVTQAEVDEALAGLSTLPEATGLTENLVIVGNRQELDGKDGRPGQGDYHADEWAGIETAEGFIDTKTGGAVVLRDEVEVREGETPAVAVARVVMHERVGHGGVNALLRTEPKFQKKWDRASGLIPAAELQSLRQKYPELADRPADLALEWLAHQTGDRLSSQSLKPGSAAAEMWQTLKDYVAKIMHAASGGQMMSDAALDAYVRDMIAGARRKVKNGEAGGGSTAASGVGNSSSNLKNEIAPRPGEADGSSLDEASAEPRLQFSKPKNPKVTPMSTGTLQSSLEDVTDPVLLEKLETENQAKFDEVREAKGVLKSPDDVAERNREQKAFVDRFYTKAAYDAIMKDLSGEVVFLAMPSSSEKNRIPVYLAKKLASDFGGRVIDGSEFFHRPKNTESKKNTTYLAKMAMPDFEMDNASWKNEVVGKKVMLVDDIITTGDSLDTIAQKIKQEGVEVEKVISLAAHNSGRGIQLDTALELMDRINEQLAGHPVQGNPILNKALGSQGDQKKTPLTWIVGAHGKSRDALLKKAIADATTPDAALAVLKAIRQRYKKLKEKD